MTDESPAAAASPNVRPIVWRGYPLHFAIPVVVGLVGLLLLLAGGAIAVFGGWWLATALPIAIGGLFRDPRLIAVPVAVWILWLIVGAIAGPDAGLANTPPFLAALLAMVGAAATYVAQRTIFPATDPEALEAARSGRVVPTLDDGADADPSIEALPVEDAEEIDPALAEAIELADETEPAEPEATAEDDAEAASDDDRDGPEADAPAEAEPDEAGAEPDDEAGAEPDDEAQAGPGDEANGDTANEAPKADAEPEPEPSEPEPVAEPSAQADPDDPLDEGQHVAEFAAITEADLAQAEAEAPLPAATRAGKRGKA